jgi:ABC-type Fe3+-hydroxamate transport system substrate-binding protein
MESLVATCRRLSDYHGMTDLPERLRDAVEIQVRQRVALAQAAEQLAWYEQQVRALAARVAELEVTARVAEFEGCKTGDVSA